MSEIVNTIGDTMTSFISSLVNTVVTGFDALLWTGEGSTRSLTSIAVFLLVLFGLGITVGASKLIYNLIRNR